MTRSSSSSAGMIVWQAAAAGFLAAAPLAAWALARSLPLNGFSGGQGVALAGGLLLIYGWLGGVIGAASGLIALPLLRPDRGWLVGSLPVLAAGGALVARGRLPLAGPPGLALGAGLAVLVALALAFTVARGRGGRLAALMLVPLVASFVWAGQRSGAAPAEAGGDPEVLERLQAASLPAAPLLVLGLDGVEWEILREILPTGTLPNLRRLIDTGAHSPLRSQEPTWSPPIWTTIWTGKLPQDHGITFFLANGTYAIPGTGTQLVLPRILGLHRLGNLLLERREVPVTSQLRKATAVWEIAGLAGRTCVLANRLVSWPALPLRGVELSSHLMFENESIPSLAFPAEVTPKALARLKQAQPWTDPGLAPTPWLSEKLGKERALWNLAAEEARDRQASLLVLYTHLIDSAHHRYLKYHWPQRFRFDVDENDVRDFGDVIAATYRAVDVMIGDVLALLPPGYRVLVVSDHGVRPNLQLTRDVPEARGATTMPPAPLDAISGVHDHAPDGIFIMNGPGVRSGELPESPSVLDVAPLVLSLLNLPPAQDMEVDEPLTVRDPQLVTTSAREAAVASYEGLIPRSAVTASSEMDEAILEELRALGYIE